VNRTIEAWSLQTIIINHYHLNPQHTLKHYISYTMASRTFTPMLRNAVRVSQRNAMAAPCRRFLNTESAPSLYSARAHVVGARTPREPPLTNPRHVDGENLKVDLTMAKALGGPGDAGKTNPEELFAAGYGACCAFLLHPTSHTPISTASTDPTQSNQL
jgi:hypothetical protein